MPIAVAVSTMVWSAYPCSLHLFIVRVHSLRWQTDDLLLVTSRMSKNILTPKFAWRNSDVKKTHRVPYSWHEPVDHRFAPLQVFCAEVWRGQPSTCCVAALGAIALLCITATGSFISANIRAIWKVCSIHKLGYLVVTLKGMTVSPRTQPHWATTQSLACVHCVLKLVAG